MVVFDDGEELPGVPDVVARGALTPAVSEPNPIFCKVSASSFPVGANPFASWKRRSDACVPTSHFPFGFPE